MVKWAGGRTGEYNGVGLEGAPMDMLLGFGFRGPTLNDPIVEAGIWLFLLAMVVLGIIRILRRRRR